MKRSILAIAFLALSPAPVLAQEGGATDLGEVLVGSSRSNAPYALQSRPVVGLRRRADSAVMSMVVGSDSRDAAVRRSEIHTILSSALDRAAGAGVELVTGNFELSPVTKANYKELPLNSGMRVDTSQVFVMIKVKLTGSALAAEQKIDAFIKGLPGSGRGTVNRSGALNLAIVNPDQYREAIVKLVAEDARRNAAIFGPGYAVRVTGIDGQIVWSQVSSTDVFLHVPYAYTIVPKSEL